MIKGNKGEWSEIYALFKLLGDRELCSGDEEINKILNFIYPIIKIIRTDNNGNFEYTIESDIIIISGNEEVFRVPISEFKEKAKYLLEQIKSNEGSFAIPEIEHFMRSINCFSLKASSSAKTDITIVVHDHITGLKPSLGFSIKSKLGSPATLLNAGETTNFIFKIVGVFLKDSDINEINSISSKSKIKDRITAIYSKGGYLEFIKLQRPIFSNNLILIDSLLPNILSSILFQFYTSNYSTIKDLTKITEEKNPLKFDVTNKHLFYEYKIKRFLVDIALGMMPSKVWSGQYDATGGYLVVKRDGDVLCYHIYNRNRFEDYLFANTKLDTASSSKHSFGEIYKENVEYFLKLNLQIRFK